MATFNASITQSADDAWQTGTYVSISNTTFELDNAGRLAGFRFQNVTIPPGSTINSAVMSVNVGNASYDDPHLDQYCEAADNAGVFVAGESNDNIGGRTLTEEKSTWSASGIGTGVHSAPNFAAAVQEVVNRGGWVSGNALVVIWLALSGCNLRCASWDHSTNPEPSITIDYTPPSAGAMAKTARIRLSTKVGGLLTS